MTKEGEAGIERRIGREARVRLEHEDKDKDGG